MNMKMLIRLLNVLFALVLALVVLSGYWVQFTRHEDPCPLCMLQRLAMIGVAIGPLLNLRFGVHTKHYALSLFSAILGGAVSLRQISLHICPGFPTFGEPVWGLSLYTWAFLTFASSIFAIGILLLLHKPLKEFPEKRKAGALVILAFALVFIVALADAITAFQQCGLTPCPA